jgi:hypothetical protein
LRYSLLLDTGSAGTLECSGHATAHPQLAIGRIYNGLSLRLGNVSLLQRDALLPH